MPRDSISLDPRLTAIAALCGKCTVVADIGTDHGRLGAYLMQTGLSQKVIFTDISDSSLEKARLLIGKLGLLSSSEFYVGDGAFALNEKPDLAVIAGMGGETIASIVRDGSEILKDSRLILQPNVAVPELRSELVRSGFSIYDERIVRDGRRLYVIIAAQKGSASYSEKELTVGPVLVGKRPPELFDYADFRIRVIRKALNGAESAGKTDKSLQNELTIWEEVVLWRE